MNIWLISAFEPVPTDNTRPMRFMGIANALWEKGHHVTFWSSSWNHFKKSQRVHKNSYIKVKERYCLNLIATKPYKKNISVSRLISHEHFAENLFRKLQSEKEPDLIYLAFPPINTAAKIAQFAGQKNIPLVIDIIDPWPDVFLNVLPEILKRPTKTLFAGYYRKIRLAFNRSSAIFSISQTYSDWARKFIEINPVLFDVFYPAVDSLVYHINVGSEEMFTKPLRFTYAGTLGTYYDIESIIEVARKFKKDDVEFIIAGDGPKRKKLEFKARGLKNVTFTGWLDAEKLKEILATSHFGIAAYTRNCTQTVTYKLFDYLAAGLPLLCSLGGEMRKIIEDNNLGYYYESENIESLYKAITRILPGSNEDYIQMKRRALKFAREFGDMKTVYGRLVKKLEKIVKE